MSGTDDRRVIVCGTLDAEARMHLDTLLDGGEVEGVDGGRWGLALL